MRISDWSSDVCSSDLGDNQDPTPIHVEEKALTKLLMTGFFMNSVVMVDVDGKPQRTLPKDVTLDVVTERPLHVDLLRISKNAKVTVSIHVRFVDEEKALGIKRGGVINIVCHELEQIGREQV